MKQYLFTALVTAVLTFVLAGAVWRLALRFKLYPAIRERDVHTRPTPRLGGIAMFLGIVVAFGFTAQNDFFHRVWIDPQPVLAILAATVLIVAVGIADDLWDLDWMIKLAAQVGAAAIIAWFGGIQIYSLPVGGLTVGSSWMSVVLTILSIVVVMNAVNFIDGLDGLVAGVALIANGVFFAWSYLLVRDTGQSTYSNLASLIAVVLVGACVGFLPWNWSPAKMFMGDSGALMLGLLMATSGIAVTGQLNPATLDPETLGRSQLLGAFIPVLLPVAVVILPLLDFGLAVIRRTGAGRSPFSPDRKHLHHRLLDLGHSDRSAVLIFYAWAAIVGLAVLLMYIATRENWPGQYWIVVGFGVLGGAACVIVTALPSRRRRPDPRAKDPA
ncbi:MAG: undecaprenyl-phosphate alpha-N-acetylglucosaminyl 1-phosphate transferase [Microbacterium sp. SCN 71-21]|uniref:MraY family glycosyltransferase n=1 Tax=Microbacterium sp. SCN 71-21 TaxID=1660116 RepID=UPI00086C0629|nr:MraY family glycosyltransferase [Microbacterium sp. SCN 71-21]ODU72567.1 MAG: undecaprenyl-phosphate alpha-N-acetylglucosaminyl 1-phosphate transferase [Microbacterium sp. SCN 71-21]